jgi:hypothetical protein
VRRQAHTLVSVIAIFVSCGAGWSGALAQDAVDSPKISSETQSQIELHASELLENLEKAPATLLDVGLMKLQVQEQSFFAANKPEVFSKQNFVYLVAEYDHQDKAILVELQHRSSKTTEADLLSECKDDVLMLRDALRPNAPMIGRGEVAVLNQRDLMCAQATSLFMGVATDSVSAPPGANVCNLIEFWAHVSSVDGKTAACKRRFFDDVTEAWIAD